MNKFDLLIRRIIALFLNAHDKIKTMALLSKEWNQFIYSGFAWESLFNPSYDHYWKKEKIS